MVRIGYRNKKKVLRKRKKRGNKREVQKTYKYERYILGGVMRCSRHCKGQSDTSELQGKRLNNIYIMYCKLRHCCIRVINSFYTQKNYS